MSTIMFIHEMFMTPVCWSVSNATGTLCWPRLGLGARGRCYRVGDRLPRVLGHTHLVLSIDGGETAADFAHAWVEKSHVDQLKSAVPV